MIRRGLGVTQSSQLQLPEYGIRCSNIPPIVKMTNHKSEARLKVWASLTAFSDLSIVYDYAAYLSCRKVLKNDPDLAACTWLDRLSATMPTGLCADTPTGGALWTSMTCAASSTRMLSKTIATLDYPKWTDSPSVSLTSQSRGMFCEAAGRVTTRVSTRNSSTLTSISSAYGAPKYLPS